MFVDRSINFGERNFDPKVTLSTKILTNKIFLNIMPLINPSELDEEKKLPRLERITIS
jgi:hypothetical protein